MFSDPHETAISVRGLRRSYDDREVLRGVDLDVARGEVFCLLGPNGAGKTTMTEIIEGFRRADAGEVRIFGHDPQLGERALRERIGIVLQECGFQDELTVGELLEMYGRPYPHPMTADEAIDLVELDAKRDERVKNLSGGQRRRLDVALGLVGNPDLVFLDEPTTGFDPAARRRAWATVRRLAERGTTIFLTTHFLDEAQALADRVAVLRDGEIVALGTPAELGGRDALPAEIRFRLPDHTTLGDLPVTGAEALEERPGEALLRTTDPMLVVHTLTGWALDHGTALRGFTVAQPTLEDVYLTLTTAPEEVAA